MADRRTCRADPICALAPAASPIATRLSIAATQARQSTSWDASSCSAIAPSSRGLRLPRAEQSAATAAASAGEAADESAELARAGLVAASSDGWLAWTSSASVRQPVRLIALSEAQRAARHSMSRSLREAASSASVTARPPMSPSARIATADALPRAGSPGGAPGPGFTGGEAEWGPHPACRIDNTAGMCSRSAATAARLFTWGLAMHSLQSAESSSTDTSSRPEYAADAEPAVTALLPRRTERSRNADSAEGGERLDALASACAKKRSAAGAVLRSPRANVSMPVLSLVSRSA